MLKLKRGTIRSIITNILIFLVLALAVEYWQSRNMTRGGLPDALRHGSLPVLSGGTRTLWNPEKWTVVYVFAPWCGVCLVNGGNIDELPNSFHKAALALSWEKATDLEGFVQKTGLKVPVLMGQDAEERALQIGAYPSYLIVDTNGTIVKAWSGYTTTFGLWFKSYWSRLWAARV